MTIEPHNNINVIHGTTTTPGGTLLRHIAEEHTESVTHRNVPITDSTDHYIPSTTQTSNSNYDSTNSTTHSNTSKRRGTNSQMKQSGSTRTAATINEINYMQTDTSPSHSQSHSLQTPTNDQRYIRGSCNSIATSTLNSPKRTHIGRPASLNTVTQHTERHVTHSSTPSITYSRVKVMPMHISLHNTPLMKAIQSDRRPSQRMSLDSNQPLYSHDSHIDDRLIDIVTQNTQTKQLTGCDSTHSNTDLNSSIAHFNARMIGLKDEIQPAFRADGEVDANYIYKKQHARRLFIQNACYVFAFIYAVFEVLYVITPNYDITQNWICILLRGLAAGFVLLYAGVILRLKQLIEQDLLESTATAVMTICGIVLVIIEILRDNEIDPVTNDALVLSIILLYSFTDVVLRIKFVYACIQAIVIFSLYNILMLTTQTQSVQYVLLSDAYMILMLMGLLLLCRDSEIYRRNDFASKRQLFTERRKAEALMRTMLPQQILTEYLDGRMAQISAIATIGYCEIKLLQSNTNVSYQQPSPAEMMQKLHDTFKRIDSIINMFAIRGVNKIETVSKTYLLCGGLLQDVDDHAAAMIETALEITNMIQRSIRPNQRLPIVVRFGISTGHVVGGIIGAQRRYFRVFGDTVNVAARMCMNTQIGSIQISQQCYAALTDQQRSTLKAKISEPRELHIKGKGVMSCYTVETRDDWIPQFGKSVQFRGNLADKQAEQPLLNKSFVYHTLINHTSLHPLKLTYYGKHNAAMEQQFQSNYTQTFVTSIKRVNIVFIGWLVACCIYVLVRHYDGNTSVSDDSVPVLCASLIGIMSATNLLLYTRLVRTHMQHMLTAGIVALSAWVICTLELWGLDGPVDPTFSMFTVILYTCLLMRLQFRYATPVICSTVIAYLIVLLVNNVHWYDITLVMIHIVVCSITGIVTMTRFEHRIRLNFLLKYALEQEQLHMDEFLSNLLPTFVVDVLRKRNGRPVLLPGQNEYTSDNRHGLAHPNDQLSSRFSMKFKCCTVFESDIVGYTAMVGNWSADKTLNMLNSIFNLFDECASICKVEKIETIGDAFMCVVFDGQPDPVLNFSLMIQSVLYERNKQSSADEQVHIRIGVSTGSCFGGVIGTKIPRFHLFGDAHDHAILIEQNGRADECIVSATTYEMSKLRYNYDVLCNTASVDNTPSEVMHILKGAKRASAISSDDGFTELNNNSYIELSSLQMKRGNMPSYSNTSVLTNSKIMPIIPHSRGVSTVDALQIA